MGAAKPVFFAAFLAAAALAVLPEAAAARPKPMPFWERPAPKGESEAVRALRAYAACVAQAPEASLVLRTTPGSAQEAAALRALVRRRRACFPNGQLRMRAYLLRGAVAERQYLAEAARRPDGLSTISPPETFGAFSARLAAAARNRLDAGGRKILAWQWMAYCAVHGDPAAAAALLRSASSDQAEIDALRALRPALEACLAPEHWAELRAVTIRALLAEALFQRLLARP